MMNVRPLKMVDAPLMLEWMHDPDCVENLQGNFASKTICDCENFIASTETDQQNLHMAIVDDTDTYMGTVSLKHIDREKGSAEFAIAIRSCAMGKGISQYGMRKIIEIGLNELGLDMVFWCVSPVNKRAVRFYDKNGYKRVHYSEVPAQGYTQEQIESFFWYVVQK